LTIASNIIGSDQASFASALSSSFFSAATSRTDSSSYSLRRAFSRSSFLVLRAKVENYWFLL
jgi:hypothetical protein